MAKELDNVSRTPETGADYLAGVNEISLLAGRLLLTIGIDDESNIRKACELTDVIRGRIDGAKDADERFRLVEALLTFVGGVFQLVDRPFPPDLTNLEDYIIRLMQTDDSPRIREKIIQRYHYCGGLAFLEALATVAATDKNDDVRYFAVLDSLWVARRREDPLKVRVGQAAILKDAFASSDYMRRLAGIHALPVAFEDGILTPAEVEALLMDVAEREKDATLQMEAGLRIGALAQKSEVLKKAVEDILGRKEGKESLRLGVEMGRAITDKRKETLSAYLHDSDTKKSVAAMLSLAAGEEEWAWAVLSDFIRGVSPDKKETPSILMRKLALCVWLEAYDKQVSKQYEKPEYPEQGMWKMTPQLEAFSLWLKNKTCWPLVGDSKTDPGLHFLCVAGVLSHHRLPEEWSDDQGFAKILETAASSDFPIPSRLLLHNYILTQTGGPGRTEKAASAFRNLVDNPATPRDLKEQVVRIYAASIAAFRPESKEKARTAFFDPAPADSKLAAMAAGILADPRGPSISYDTRRALFTFHFDVRRLLRGEVDEATSGNPLGTMLVEMWAKYPFTPEENETARRIFFGAK
ncbi:MAG: hypothetical protein RDV41_01945 [Planctomycetota bacterium]|nr:hypothetical protein [Planctomycetota bacterium]